MRKLFIVFSLFGLFSTSSFATSGKELAENSKSEKPTKSIYLPNKEILIKRYVLADESENSILDLTQKVIREFGSNRNKSAHIIWVDKGYEKIAKKIHKDLMKKNVHSKSISLERGKMKKDIYPLYVEIKSISTKRVSCKVDTAEDMMSPDSYIPCASKSNFKIQLRN